MDAVIAALTAVGLSTAAGLNALLPLLVLGGLARFTDLISLEAPYDALAEPGMLIALAAIAVVDFVGDKVPAIDSVLHAIGLVIAPVAGAVVALAATGTESIEPAFAIVVGATAAATTHGARSVVRPTSTAFTGGAGNPLLSFGEDALSAVLSFGAVIVPVAAFVLVLACLGVSFLAVRRAIRKRRA